MIVPEPKFDRILALDADPDHGFPGFGDGPAGR